MEERVWILAGYPADQSKVIAHAYKTQEGAEAKAQRLRDRATAEGKPEPTLRVVERTVLESADDPPAEGEAATD